MKVDSYMQKGQKKIGYCLPPSEGCVLSFSLESLAFEIQKVGPKNNIIKRIGLITPTFKFIFVNPYNRETGHIHV